jgi:hypothetical protein
MDPMWHGIRGSVKRSVGDRGNHWRKRAACARMSQYGMACRIRQASQLSLMSLTEMA